MKTNFIIIVIIIFCNINAAWAKIDTVIIDAGHGGKDPGAIEKILGIKEKENNLAIALFLRNLIKEKLPWMKVYLTRNSDRYLSLNDRTKIVNSLSESKALFVSIHTNSQLKPGKKTEGIEVFFYNSHSSSIEEARTKEIEFNYTGSFSETLKKPLTQLVDHKARADSKILADEIAKGLKLASKEPIRRVSPSKFFVVSYTVLPSVLVEVGFISSKKFTSKTYKKKIAKGILLGILSFIKKEDKF